MPAKTLISESGCCCFSLEDLQTEEEGQKNWGRKKFTPGRGEREKKELQSHTLAMRLKRTFGTSLDLGCAHISFADLALFQSVGLTLSKGGNILLQHTHAPSGF